MQQEANAIEIMRENGRHRVLLKSHTRIDIVEGRASPPTAVANPTLRRERAFVEGTGVLGSSRYQLYTDTAVRSVRGSQV